MNHPSAQEVVTDQRDGCVTAARLAAPDPARSMIRRRARGTSRVEVPQRRCDEVGRDAARRPEGSHAAGLRAHRHSRCGARCLARRADARGRSAGTLSLPVALRHDLSTTPVVDSAACERGVTQSTRRSVGRIGRMQVGQTKGRRVPCHRRYSARQKHRCPRTKRPAELGFSGDRLNRGEGAQRSRSGRSR